LEFSKFTFGLIISLPTKNTSLHSHTISNSLIRVDTLAWLLAIKEVLQQLLHYGILVQSRQLIIQAVFAGFRRHKNAKKTLKFYTLLN
jgi:hypothetical protein